MTDPVTGSSSRVLLAAYPRSGSTVLAACLGEVMGCTALHEPFRQQAGPATRLFSEQTLEETMQRRLIKHHPGNLLTPRQNRQLYERWIAQGGSIVHLRRTCIEDQARSLAIARSLNSYHRKHRVSVAPAARVAAERATLEREIRAESTTLAAFPHLDVSYEQLFRGTLDERLEHFQLVLERLVGVAGWSDVGPPARRRIGELLAPQNRVAQEPEDGAKLIGQVPLIAGCYEWPGDLPPAVRDPIAAIDAPPYGIGIATLRDETSLVMAIRLALQQTLNVELVDSPSIPLRMMNYDGDRWPDHDAGIFNQISPSEQAIRFSLCLDAPVSPGDGVVHLAGHGPAAAADAVGSLACWSSGYGARRSPVTTGTACYVTGSFPIRPNQILTAGQVLGDAGQFAD